MMKFAHIDTGTKTIIKRIQNHPRADRGATVIGLQPGTAIVPVRLEDPPAIDRRIFRAQRTEPTVSETEVVVGWEVVPLPTEEVIANIKLEASRRIRADFPEYQQRNTMASMLDVIDRKAEEKQLAEDPAAEAAARIRWNWVQQVRAESNAKEQAVRNGEPFDLDDWPEAP